MENLEMLLFLEIDLLFFFCKNRVLYQNTILLYTYTLLFIYKKKKILIFYISVEFFVSLILPIS